MRIFGINTETSKLIKPGSKCYNCIFIRGIKEKYNSSKYNSIICCKLSKEVVNNYSYCKYKKEDKISFNLGDIVKTKDDLIEFKKYKGITFFENMNFFGLKIDRIEHLYDKDIYVIGQYSYSDEMIEKI